MPDFSKVWASNSPLPAYTFSDADYLTGWDFVGSAPPTKNEFDAWFKMVDEKLNYLYGQLQTTASKLYPVGSVYISFDATDPTTLFGGTWTRLKDRMLMAAGDTYAINTTGGSATVTLSTNQIPSHTHSITTNGSHTHTASSASAGVHNHTVSGSISTTGNHNHTLSGTTSATGNHAHTRGTMEITGTFNVGANGYYTDGAFTTASSTYPHIDSNVGAGCLNYKFTASRTWTGSTSTAGNHAHTFSATTSTAGNHTHTWSGSIGNNGSHTHTITVASNGNHTHTIGNTGGGLPVNILPPYQTVYMWRRTA